MFWRDYAYLEHCWSCYGNVTIWQCGLQRRKMKATIDTYSGPKDRLIFAIFSLPLGVWSHEVSQRTSDNQGLEGAVRAGLEERGQMSSRQEVKVEHKVSVAAFTSRYEKWVGEGREEDTTEERWEGERERRFRLKVTGKGVGGTRVAKCNVNLMKKWSEWLYQNVICSTIACVN